MTGPKSLPSVLRDAPSPARVFFAYVQGVQQVSREGDAGLQEVTPVAPAREDRQTWCRRYSLRVRQWEVNSGLVGVRL